MKQKNEAAAALGRIKSDKKTAAARANGALGGRPPMEITRVEEIETRGGAYSQLWRRGDDWTHVVFYIHQAQTQGGFPGPDGTIYTANGNTDSAVRYCAKWKSEKQARKSHAEFVANRA